MWHCDFSGILDVYEDNKNGWHVLREDSDLEQESDYPYFGDTSTNPYPARHFMVELLQSDGNNDIQKGTNRGDKSDLFRYSTRGQQNNAGYLMNDQGTMRNVDRKKIGPSGLSPLQRASPMATFSIRVLS